MPSTTRKATTVSETSELAGQKPTFTALPNWLLGKASALEIAVLWVLQSHYPEIRPSITRLATCANLSRRTVFNVLADLERKGWLVRVHREFESGKKAPNLYRLTIWDGEPKGARPVSRDGAGDAPVQEMHHRDSAGDARGIVQEMHGHSAGDAHEVDQEEEEQLEEQPSLSVSPAEPQPAAPDEGAGAPTSKLKLTPADIPADLSPAADLLCTWWNHHKGGKRTQRALKTQLTELAKIAADPRGGIEAIRAQLQKAITSDELGRRWAGITFDRWQEFGCRSSLRFGNGSGTGYRSTRDRKDAEINDLLAFLAVADPEFAAPGQGGSSTTTNQPIDWESLAHA